MQDEKFWESPFIPSHPTFKKVFNFQSFSHNQSHNNKTNNHNNSFNITFQNLEFWDVTRKNAAAEMKKIRSSLPTQVWVAKKE